MAGRAGHSSTLRRREFLELAAAGTLATALGSGGCGSRDSASGPNVLLMAADDLNDWIGCLGGHPDAKTPNIDALADRGVLFTRAYANSPLCNPSRASAMSGLAPSTTGLFDNHVPWRAAMPGVVTMPEYFSEHDRHVVGGGKIFHGGAGLGKSAWLARHAPWRVGRKLKGHIFGAWDDYYVPHLEPTPAVVPANGIRGTGSFDWAPVDVSEEEMDDFQLSQWVANKLERRHGSPFLLACGFSRTHKPWYLPREYYERYDPERVRLPEVREDDLDDVPEAARRWAGRERHATLLSGGHWGRAVAAYLAGIEFVDSCIGRVVAALDDGPNADDTIVVLWSDHGMHLGEKEHWEKATLWEEATRVPLIIASPQSPAPGARCERTVSLVDLYPTLLDLCGLPAKPDLDGRSLAPLLEDPSQVWEYPVLSSLSPLDHSVRSERWRYVRYADGSEELYDHAADPAEWSNLAAADTPETSRVKAELSRWLPAAAPGSAG